MNRIGLIMSAGNETRFEGDKPKSLSMIGDKCLLDMNIGVLKEFCNDVKVVVSTKNESYFHGYDTITIESGKGCGDAVMKALAELKCSSSDTCIIMWGDCIANREVIELMLGRTLDVYDIIVPCHYESKPYVSLTKVSGYISASFSKYGEIGAKEHGFHDFGMFYGFCNIIASSLMDLANRHVDVHGNYIHKHGNELNFLDIFNETEIVGDLLEIDDIEPKSFNTLEELSNLYEV